MKYTYPKIELHLHLDGSIRPETVWELYQKEGLLEDGVDYETFTRDAAVLEPCLDVNDCLTKFDLPLKIMQDREYIVRITKELVCDLAEQGVVHGEIRFAPQLHTQKGLSQKEVIEAVIEGKEEGLKLHPEISISLILCCMSIGLETVNKEENLETVRLCKEYLGKGVNALDLAGADASCPCVISIISSIWQENWNCLSPATAATARISKQSEMPWTSALCVLATAMQCMKHLTCANARSKTTSPLRSALPAIFAARAEKVMLLIP